MSTKKTLERAIELIDWEQLEADKVDAAASNRRIGLGIASYHEAAPGPANFADSMQPGSGMLLGEQGRATITEDGRIVMYTASRPTVRVIRRRTSRWWPTSSGCRWTMSRSCGATPT